MYVTVQMSVMCTSVCVLCTICVSVSVRNTISVSTVSVCVCCVLYGSARVSREMSYEV